jgi:hypothetical protein
VAIRAGPVIRAGQIGHGLVERVNAIRQVILLVRQPNSSSPTTIVLSHLADLASNSALGFGQLLRLKLKVGQCSRPFPSRAAAKALVKPPHLIQGLDASLPRSVGVSPA